MPGTSLTLTAQQVLPLSARLRRHFSSQLDRVPARTRDLLLMLALNPTGDLTALAGRSSDPIVDLEPAARVGLVVIDPVRFTYDIRHPLIRSAIVGIAPTADRRKAHTALADASTNPRPARLAPGRGLLRTERARRLATGGRRARILAKGDTVGGVTALMRAGSLSPNARDRSRRIAEVAYIGAKINGNLSEVSELLTEARSADPDTRDSLETAVAAAYAVLDGDGDIVTAHRLLVGAIEVSERRYDPEDPFLVEALHVLFQVCLWAERGDLFPPFDAVVSDLGQAVPESLWFQNVVLRDPARVSTSALGRLDQAIAGLDLETDVVRIGAHRSGEHLRRPRLGVSGALGGSSKTGGVGAPSPPPSPPSCRSAWTTTSSGSGTLRGSWPTRESDSVESTGSTFRGGASSWATHSSPRAGGNGSGSAPSQTRC